MRSMGDPDYVYAPLSKERREKMAATSRRNRGIPDGYRQLYGVNVPEKYIDLVKPIVARARSQTDDLEAIGLLIRVLVRIPILLDEENRDLLLMTLALSKLPRRR